MLGGGRETNIKGQDQYNRIQLHTKLNKAQDHHGSASMMTTTSMTATPSQQSNFFIPNKMFSNNGSHQQQSLSKSTLNQDQMQQRHSQPTSLLPSLTTKNVQANSQNMLPQYSSTQKLQFAANQGSVASSTMQQRVNQRQLNLKPPLLTSASPQVQQSNHKMTGLAINDQSTGLKDYQEGSLQVGAFKNSQLLTPQVGNTAQHFKLDV